MSLLCKKKNNEWTGDVPSHNRKIWFTCVINIARESRLPLIMAQRVPKFTIHDANNMRCGKVKATLNLASVSCLPNTNLIFVNPKQAGICQPKFHKNSQGKIPQNARSVLIFLSVHPHSSPGGSSKLLCFGALVFPVLSQKTFIDSN